MRHKNPSLCTETIPLHDQEIPSRLFEIVCEDEDDFLEFQEERGRGEDGLRLPGDYAAAQERAKKCESMKTASAPVNIILVSERLNY